MKAGSVPHNQTCRVRDEEKEGHDEGGEEMIRVRGKRKEDERRDGFE